MSPAPARLPSLTGMRFVAAFFVVLCHIGIQAVPRIAPNDTLLTPYVFAAGGIGVSFFFILSGFILTWVAQKSDTRRQFWRRRVVKIFPLQLVTLAMFTVALLIAGLPINAWGTITQLLLIQSFVPSQSILLDFTSNTPAWSLACEMFFYALFPWLLILLSRVPARRLGLAALVAVLGMAAMPAIAGNLPAEPGMLGTTEPWYPVWFTYFLPVSRLWEFILGIILARYLLSGRRLRISIPLAAALCIVAFIIGAQVPDPWGEVLPTAIPLTLLIAAVAQHDLAGRPGPLSSRAMVFLGEISFALYISHLFVVLYGPLRGIDASNWYTTSPPLTVAWQSAATVVLSLALAWLLYALVERPAMRWSRPRRPVAANVTPLTTGASTQAQSARDSAA